MGDEEDPWGFDGGDDTAAAPAAASAGASAGASAAAGTPAKDASKSEVTSIKSHAGSADNVSRHSEGPPAEGEIEQAAAPPPPPEDDGYRKPVQLYRHWVRPKFLQYKYMYNYRTNYYDDVIDYLDKKQVGVSRDIPRPQTWAERVLRTNNVSGSHLDPYASSIKRDKHLVQTLAASIRTYNYHTKAYLNQKYAHVL